MEGITKEESSRESESSEEEEVTELPQAKGPVRRGPRSSVSAEVFGKWNKKGEFHAPKYEKTAQVREALKKRIEQAFMFSALNPEELSIVLDAMQNVKKAAGELVIREGDEGDCLYVVESGILTCTKIFVRYSFFSLILQKGQTEPTFLKEYHAGEAFGELALLYNAPRAATIVAKTEAELWQLDRQTFNYIVKEAAAKKREKYEEFLKDVKILANMDEYERAKLADAFREEWYEVDDLVIREGDSNGDTFYLVMSGEAVATKTMEKGKPLVQVYKYGTGDYFGERALIKNEPRAANIIAVTRLHLVALDRQSFKRLLGPIEEILKRNIGLYTQYC